jgi:hypothetical protein
MVIKKLYFLIVLIFTCALITVFSMNTYAQAPEGEDLTPTPPPKVPAADFSVDGANYLDVMYLRYSGDMFTMNGFGLGYNYVGAFDKIGFNIGFGVQYLTGEDDDGYFDMEFVAVPINANLAFRVAGTANSNNLILFGGIHYNYSYTNIQVDAGVFDAYDHELEIHLWVYGPLLGAKANIRLGPSLNFVPYYALKRDIIDSDVYVDGESFDISIPSATSHLFGFDIEIGAISIGTMLNMLNNTNNDMIVIYLTWNLDFKESSTTGSE